MTKRKDTKAKAFTCRGAAALITAALLTAALLFTGCPQSPENQTQNPSVPPGPDPNLRIEDGVLKGYNETPSGALVIPAGVTEIAGEVFSDCTGLTQVDFSQCASLTKIGAGAFASCRGLMQLNLPASLEMLDSYAFYGCTKITGRVILPANLKTIANYAFYSCEKVDAFDFSQCTRITKIGDSAFRYCTKITTVKLPKSLTEIAGNAFLGCTELATLTVQPGGDLIEEGGIIYNSGKTKLLCRVPKVVPASFPGTLKEIVGGAFQGCIGLTQLNLPANLETLGYSAFHDCSEITGRVVLPANLKTIGNDAFHGCSKVDAFDFSQCTRITKIGDSAFRHCSKITTVNLPKSLTEIAGNTFVGCTELETLTVQPGGDLIEESGIIYNSGKTKLLCSVPKVTSVSFPTGLKEIVGGAFQDCIGLTQLNLPVSLETIGNDTFSNCTKITGTVVLPANLKTIGSFAFYGCNKVDAFDFSQCTQLTSIDRNAFSSCKEEAVYKVKTGSGIKTLLLDSHSGIKASQITEVP